jgi:hypothetical protein
LVQPVSLVLPESLAHLVTGMEVKPIMPSCRFLHWHPAGVCMVPVAVVTASLIIGGVANSAPPGNTPQATDSVAATATSTALATSPASPVAQGTPVTLIATITPATAVGTVQFKDGTTNLGNPVAVSNGTASRSTSTLAVGSHSLTAVFTPSDPTAFNPSMSPAVPLTVTGSGVGSQIIISQQSGLSLDVQVSVLDDRVSVLDGGPSILDTSMPVLDGQGAVLDARLSVLVGQELLSGVVRPARTEVTPSER